MKSYFEDINDEVEIFPCDVCMWNKMDSEKPPCIYCEEYGGLEPPKDFDYKKLRKDKLGF